MTTGTPNTFEERAPGAWYVVVLGNPTPSPASTRTGTFPVPDMGSACVCCDSADTTYRNYDPSTGAMVSSSIPIPLCAGCKDHVQLNEKRVLYLVVAIFLGVGLGVLGAVLTQLIVAAVGAVLLAGSIGILLADRTKRINHCKAGRYVGLEIATSFGVCSVRTMNRRLANRLAEKHRHELLTVR